MGGALQDTTGAPLCTGTDALHGRTLVHVCLQDEQVGLVEGLAGVLSLDLRVGDGAQEHLADIGGDGLRGEPQNVGGLQNTLAANLVHNTAGLLGRDADESRLRLGFHVSASSSVGPAQRRRPLRSSLSWLRKVRVGANSPSLWPTIDSVTKNGHMLTAVVDGDGQTQEVRG